METLLMIVGKLIGALFAIICLALYPKVKTWLECKAGTEAANGIISTVEQFVLAADQMFKAEDADGSIRNKYVKDQLTSIGIKITDEINAYIEAAVLKMKK